MNSTYDKKTFMQTSNEEIIF